ncbi:hypothetical protein PDESU_01033 [Pontiella desulfatans]|uniref:Uncharacterized protein n=1 Tax=Pontiella desulfatans TaxID=2750659 RepID=A0A6C2TXT7_PONDE|nr:hypothetical protein PDESU_01033 [Pontiella desulfatans]
MKKTISTWVVAMAAIGAFGNVAFLQKMAAAQEAVTE